MTRLLCVLILRRYTAEIPIPACGGCAATCSEGTNPFPNFPVIFPDKQGICAGDPLEPLWRLSADRMKMNREHLVPLPRQAAIILKRLKELSPDSLYLFPAGTRHGVISENTMLYAIYRMGYHSRQTTHGLRRSASTVLNETGLFEPDWVEAQLAHTEQNKVRGAYNAALYLKHRRTMLQWWADYIDRQGADLRVVA